MVNALYDINLIILLLKSFHCTQICFCFMQFKLVSLFSLCLYAIENQSTTQFLFSLSEYLFVVPYLATYGHFTIILTRSVLPRIPRMVSCIIHWKICGNWSSVLIKNIRVIQLINSSIHLYIFEKKEKPIDNNEIVHLNVITTKKYFRVREVWCGGMVDSN